MCLFFHAKWEKSVMGHRNLPNPSKNVNIMLTCGIWKGSKWFRWLAEVYEQHICKIVYFYITIYYRVIHHQQGKSSIFDKFPTLWSSEMDLSQRNHLDPFPMPQVSIIFTFFEGIGRFLWPITLFAHFCYTCATSRTFTRQAPHMITPT